MMFLCTGNTCRSQMAEGMARHMVQVGLLPAGAFEFSSAGVSAKPGELINPKVNETLQVRLSCDCAAAAIFHVHLQKLGMATFDGAVATLFSPQHAAAVDAIFCMTAGHLDQAVSMLSENQRGKLRLMDPTGADIADPIGQPQTVYDDVGRRLLSCIQQQLLSLK